MRYILVNQHIGHLFKEVIHDFAKREVETVVLTGWIEAGGKPLDPSVQIWKGMRYNRKSTLSRLWSWTVFTLQIWWRLSRCKSHDTRVLFVSNPPFGPLLAPLFGLPYAILVYDLYPDVLVSTGLLGAGHPFVRWWGNRNQIIFDRAERVFTLSDAMREAVWRYFPDPAAGKDRVRVIPNWANDEHIFPVEKVDNPFLITHQLAGKFIVLYSGNMGDTHPLEALLPVAAALQDETDIVFVFIGDGPKRPLLERTVRDQKLRNVLFLPFQPFDQIRYSLSAADLNVIALDEGAASSSVPSKTYSALAAGSALLGMTAPDSEVAQLIRAQEAGRSFRPAETAAMIEFIGHMQAEPDTLLQYKKNALQASRRYTPANAALYFEEWSKAQGAPA